MAVGTRGAASDQVSYEDLYARWEKGNWSATALDFTQDREDWNERFDDLRRRAALWNYALFFHGEDSVADNLSPYIDAAPREEQKYFLATQQVDEARHAVFFARFMREVVGVDGTGGVAATLAATEPELTWGFRKVFARLDRMADELRRDRSKPKLAAAVTLYHLVVEATLAQPGQHFIERYLVDMDVLPGFREGMRNVSLDEQRHIGFGVKLISDLVREDPECIDAIAEILREVIPYSLGVFVPPGWDERYATSFGFTLEEIFTEATISIDSKLRAAGIRLEDLPGVPLHPDLAPEERTRRGLALLRGNHLGEKLGPPTRDPEVVEMLFDSIRRAVNPKAVPPRPATVQWDFTDFEPWHLRLDNGSTSVQRGRVERPDLTFRCRFEDWVDLSAGREDARRALLRGKLRMRGRPGMLWRARELFG